MNADYWQRKDQLLRQLAADRGLSSADLAVAIYVVTHLNAKSFVAWPGSDNIAKATGLTDRSVRRSLRRLEGKHFVLQGARNTSGTLIGGRGRSIEFVPIIHTDADKTAGCHPNKPGQSRPGLERVNPDEIDRKPGRNRPLNPDEIDPPLLERLVEETPGSKNKAHQTSSDLFPKDGDQGATSAPGMEPSWSIFARARIK